MKIVFSADEGGPVSNMRYEDDGYELQDGEVIYAGTEIPNLTPLATRNGNGISDDPETWRTVQAIPAWAIDLINVVVGKGIVAVDDLSSETQVVISATTKVKSAVKGGLK